MYKYTIFFLEMYLVTVYKMEEDLHLQRLFSEIEIIALLFLFWTTKKYIFKTVNNLGLRFSIQPYDDVNFQLHNILYFDFVAMLLDNY